MLDQMNWSKSNSFPSQDFSFGQGQCKSEDLRNAMLGVSLRILKRKHGREQPVEKNVNCLPITILVFNVESNSFFFFFFWKNSFFTPWFHPKNYGGTQFPSAKTNYTHRLSKPSDLLGLWRKYSLVCWSPDCRDSLNVFKNQASSF